MGDSARDNWRRKRGHKSKSPPFVQLQHWLLDTDRWHGLSFAARAAYVELLRVYNGCNNGSLGMSVRTLAARLPCSNTTAARVLSELEVAGFIEVEKVGAFHRKERHASEYALTAYRNDVTCEPPTKKFNPAERWAAIPHKRDPLSGFVGQAGTRKWDRSVPKTGTDHSRDHASVPKNGTDRAVSAPPTVPKTGTHLDLDHAPLASMSATAADAPNWLGGLTATTGIDRDGSATAVNDRRLWSTPSLVEDTASTPEQWLTGSQSYEWTYPKAERGEAGTCRLRWTEVRRRAPVAPADDFHIPDFLRRSPTVAAPLRPRPPPSSARSASHRGRLRLRRPPRRPARWPPQAGKIRPRHPRRERRKRPQRSLKRAGVEATTATQLASPMCLVQLEESIK